MRVQILGSGVRQPDKRMFAQSLVIDDIVAVDAQTVVVKAKLDENGAAVNPLIVQGYLSANYILQKAWTEKMEARTSGDPALFKADGAEDVIWSGPYTQFFNDDTKVVLIRDDEYWGQDASMWGKLPVPNDEKTVAIAKITAIHLKFNFMPNKLKSAFFM